MNFIRRWVDTFFEKRDEKVRAERTGLFHINLKHVISLPSCNRPVHGDEIDLVLMSNIGEIVIPFKVYLDQDNHNKNEEHWLMIVQHKDGIGHHKDAFSIIPPRDFNYVIECIPCCKFYYRTRITKQRLTADSYTSFTEATKSTDVRKDLILSIKKE